VRFTHRSADRLSLNASYNAQPRSAICILQILCSLYANFLRGDKFDIRTGVESVHGDAAKSPRVISDCLDGRDAAVDRQDLSGDMLPGIARKKERGTFQILIIADSV
jgi:hypothetical protein